MSPKGVRIMDFAKLLRGIDNLLFTKNLRPEEQDQLYRLRGLAEFELERQQRAMVGDAFRRALEMQNPNLFLGEKLTGGPRNIPGSEGSGVYIQPQVVPGGRIRDFVPNTSYGDRMNINPDRLNRLGQVGLLGI